ncbi:transposase, MuDR, MULE transposase domain protein, partial [Tanacetum coccineum]
DGNNQIIPIATGVSQGETEESWTWFMLKLKECIGEVPNLAIISDRHPGIILACKMVFPNASWVLLQASDVELQNEKCYPMNLIHYTTIIFTNMLENKKT